MFAHGETVVRLRATTTTDPYSGEATALDWSSPESLTIAGCGIASGGSFGTPGSVETVETDRNAIVSDFDVILPHGTDVTAADRLVVRGLTCEVQGRPFEWHNPFTGWQPGLLIRAKIVEG